MGGYVFDPVEAVFIRPVLVLVEVEVFGAGGGGGQAGDAEDDFLGHPVAVEAAGVAAQRDSLMGAGRAPRGPHRRGAFAALIGDLASAQDHAGADVRPRVAWHVVPRVPPTPRRGEDPAPGPRRIRPP